MRNVTLYLCMAVGVLFSACDDNDDSNEGVFELSQTEFQGLSCEGEQLKIDVTAYDGWVATGMPNWCKLSDTQGRGHSTLYVTVKANLEQDRSCVIELRTQKETRTIRINQQALPTGQELHYKLPIVLHVIYEDPSDPRQNPSPEFLQSVFQGINKAYKSASNHSQDMNLEFVPATLDPQGNLMSEPGVDRIQWVSSTMDMQDVMFGQERKYHHFLWEPSEYINVLLYTFDTSADPQMAGVMGVSTFPYSPTFSPMPGTELLPYTELTLANLKYAYCISINNTFVGDQNYLFPGYELDKKQMSITNTLAHELGHYLGLRHVFSESQNSKCEDTDFCADTKAYNKQEYENILLDIATKWRDDESYRTDEHFKEAFKRQNCSNEVFEAHNIMDYSYCYSDEFTANQRTRVRHVLEYSPLIPGPKKSRGTVTRSAEGELDLPITVMCIPH